MSFAQTVITGCGPLTCDPGGPDGAVETPGQAARGVRVASFQCGAGDRTTGARDVAVVRARPTDSGQG
ncbi:hypothetical protein CEB94_37245 [Streptomyces hawaiiensis]|uniref:Uncharacterized protein n=1 Tax=Streptomyces hawaiiensis TaxID=67305 RepID=A0A6G5RQH2_9ACTN|nr:hypothetical protein CEB94_37245 [Streptomyces hawaiiensis]